MATKKKTKRKVAGTRRRARTRTIDVTGLLKGYKPGDWVAVNKAHTKVLFSGPDPAEIHERIVEAGLGADAVLMWVRDPNVTYVY